LFIAIHAKGERDYLITPVRGEHGDYGLSFTLGFEKNKHGYPKFRFEFRPAAGFWLDSKWFVPTTLQPEAIRLINRLWEAKCSWESLLHDSPLDPRRYFDHFNRRISLADQIAYREGRRPLTDLSPLDAAYVEWGQCIGRVKQALRELMGIEDLCTLTLRKPSGPQRCFAYRNGVVWESPMNLTPEQWKQMIDAEAQKRGMTVAPSDAAGEQDRSNRSISIAVRREAWRRDQGKCVACGSQERLEFDHVIPVAMGGSNTVRNIQLLCERCNREKAATLG
jgi:hypothetical protein